MKNSVPQLSKCLDFLSVFNPSTKSFLGLRGWIIQNTQSRIDDTRIATTSWEYQVPFYTNNAASCSSSFGKKYRILPWSTSIDNELDMRLMHGFVCTGKNNNGTYDTKLPSESELLREEINLSTIGVKLYFFANREDNSMRGAPRPELVVVNIVLRVDKDENIVCLRIGIKTNLCFVGGMASETFSSQMRQSYIGIPTPKNKHASWTPITMPLTEAKDKDVEKIFLEKVFQRITNVLC